MSIADLCDRCKRIHTPKCGESQFERSLAQLAEDAKATGVPLDVAAAAVTKLTSSIPKTAPALLKAVQQGPFRTPGAPGPALADQDPGDVFAALADAFSRLTPDQQTATINRISKALTKTADKAMTKGKDVDALAIGIGMVRALFSSKGRVIVLRVPEAAVLLYQVAPESPLEARVRVSGVSAAADAVAVKLAQQAADSK